MDAAELRTTIEMAMLELPDDQIVQLESAVDRIIDYFSVMAAADVEGVEPTTHALGAGNRTRPDSVIRRGSVDALLENAPEVEDNLIAIPNLL